MKKYYVYRFLNSNEKIIYVGRTVNFNNRMKQHFGDSGHLPKECYDSVRKIEYLELNHPIDMIIYELYYISKYRPKYNTNDILNDNKSDVANITDNNAWITSDFLENNKKVYKDIKTLNLDCFVGKYMFDNNSKLLKDYLGDKCASLKEFFHILEEYRIVGYVDGKMRSYTEFGVNKMFEKYNIKYRLKFYVKRFDFKNSRAYRIYELQKL